MVVGKRRYGTARPAGTDVRHCSVIFDVMAAAYLSLASEVRQALVLLRSYLGCSYLRLYLHASVFYVLACTPAYVRTFALPIISLDLPADLDTYVYVCPYAVWLRARMHASARATSGAARRAE